MKSLLNSKSIIGASVILAAKLSVALAVFSANAQITLAPQFASNMVLQRDTVNLLQGYADSSERINISMNGENYKPLKLNKVLGSFHCQQPRLAAPTL